MTEQSTQSSKRLGVYGWVRSRTTPETSFFFPVPEEDGGKREATILSFGMIPLVSGMLGIVSGGVDPGEEWDVAVARETREERMVDIPLSRIHNTLPSIAVTQIRGGKHVAFDVHGHSIHLTQGELERLYGFTPLITVKDEALGRFLREEKDNLRPSVYLAGQRILQSGALARI